MPTGDRQGMRSPAEKRRALTRLLDRRARVLTAIPSLVAAALLTLLAVVGWRLAVDSKHLAPYAEAPETYELLATVSRATCEAGNGCAFGWSNPERPPAQIRALMARVGARDVLHSASATTIRGAYGARATLVRLWPLESRDSPPTGERAQLRPVGAWRDLGGGWFESAGRL